MARVAEVGLNGRDQVTKAREHKGSWTSPRYQTTNFSYDGHGRLATQHVPQQDPRKNTIYTYYSDDKVESVTDARGAVSVYTYEQRGFLARVESTLPTGSGASLAPIEPIEPCDLSDPNSDNPGPLPTPNPNPIPTPTPNPTPTPAPTPATTAVTFAYDNIGNRTQMTGTMGSVAYEYNELSQLTKESRGFNDNLPNAPISGNRFKIQYGYGLAGQLKSLTDPYNQQINYAYDEAGRLDSVTATAFGGVTNYADNPQYRAWGGLKHLEYGNGTQMSIVFNNRLQANHYELNKTGTNPEIMKKNYAYTADGRLRYLQDQLSAKFDRLNIYDHAGRIKQAKTGAEARGGTVNTYGQQKNELPYRQSYQFNEYNNLTERNNLHWGTDSWDGQSNNLSYSYYNDRVANQGWQHDADGRAVTANEPNSYVNSEYDARGLVAKITTNYQREAYRYYDGNGREVKRGGSNYVENPNATTPPFGSWAAENPTYYIRSSVLGNEVISEVNHLGKRTKGYVRAAGTTLATQTGDTANPQNQYVYFEHTDASGMSYRATMNTGAPVATHGFDAAPAELDPMGGNAGLFNPYITFNPPPIHPEIPTLQPFDSLDTMRVNGQQLSCSLDGISVSCGLAFSSLQSGSANIDFANTNSWTLSQLARLSRFALVFRLSARRRHS